MLTVTELNQAGKNASGHAMLDYLKQTEYYKDKDGKEVSASRWLGKGAASLQLSGAVNHEAMDQLAQGYSPSGEALCKNAGADHRVGYDCTFSADKSVSVLFAAATAQEREAILAAHRNAVAEAVDYLERQATTRRGAGGAVEVKVEGLVASGFTHFASRDLDPQLHEHVLIYNVALGEDGQWSTWNTDLLCEYQRAAGALYRAALARNLRDIGYGVEKQVERDADNRETGQIYFGVVGVDESVQQAFSQRRAAIESYMQQHNVSAQQACLATRKNKSEPSFDELTQLWDDTLDTMRQQDATLFQDAQSLKGKASQVEGLSDVGMLKKLHRMESTFTRAQLVERIALENVGRLSIKEIEREAQVFLERAPVIQLRNNGKNQEQYVAQYMLSLEQGIVERGNARCDDQSVRVRRELIGAAITEFESEKKATLTEEQRRAVEWVCGDTGGTCCVTGFAGTGKTFSALAFKKAFDADGRRLIGVAIAWDAAKKLEAETGMEAYSAASLLDRLKSGKLQLNAKDVVVLDEAGMAGTATIAALQTACDKAGAKLVLQGDVLQLQPVEAGGAFRLAIESVGDARLTEIRRQQNDADRKTARMFYGLDNEGLPIDGQAILDRLHAQGQIVEADYRPEAIKQLVNDYFASHTPAREKLVLAGTRAEVKALNHAIREEYKSRGGLGSGQLLKVKAGGELKTIELASGDRIRFAEKNKALGVFNGTQGVVENLRLNSDGSLDILVRLESDIPSQEGRIVKFNSKDFASLDHSYAMTVHKSQGQGRGSVFVLANAGMTDLHFALVAFTRTKQFFRLYGAKDDLSSMGRRFGRERLKTNASDQLQEQQSQQEKLMQRLIKPVNKLINLTGKLLRLNQQHTATAACTTPIASVQDVGKITSCATPTSQASNAIPATGKILLVRRSLNLSR
jgi:conjugative relaxase-like TrwC/TraI family protein